MENLIKLIFCVIAVGTATAQTRLEWISSSEIVAGAYLADIVRTDNGALYALCFTRESPTLDRFHVSSSSSIGQPFKLIWTPSGNTNGKGGQTRMQVNGNSVYFRAEDGSLMVNQQGIDWSVRSCSDTSYWTRIDVETDGTVFLTGARRLEKPEYDSAYATTRYATTNVSIPSKDGCQDLIVCRSEFKNGFPATVGKNSEGQILVAYHSRPASNATILRSIDESPVGVQLVEDQWAYDVELIKPEQDGWLFHLVRRRQGTSGSQWLVRTDKELTVTSKVQVEPAHYGAYRFSEVCDGKILILSDDDVMIYNERSLELETEYTTEQVVPAIYREYGTMFVTATVYNNHILIGTMDGYSVMTMPTTSVAEHPSRVNSSLISSEELVKIQMPSNCGELNVYDLSGRRIIVRPSLENGVAFVRGDHLSTGVNFISTCDGSQTIVFVSK